MIYKIILLLVATQTAYAGCFDLHLKNLFKIPKNERADLRLLYELQSHSEGQLFKDSELLALGQIMKNADLTAADKAKKAFEMTVDARLRWLKKDEAKKVREVIDHAIYININDTDPFSILNNPVTEFRAQKEYGAYYKLVIENGIQNKERVYGPVIKINIRDHHRQTAFMYAIMIHELEHVIQHVTGLSRLGVDTFTKTTQRYIEEMAAIQMEWQYLSLIPKEQRTEILEQILKDDFYTISGGKDVFKRFLNADSKTAKEHLKNEHKNGRYNYSNTYVAVNERWIVPLAQWTSTGIVSSFVFLYFFNDFCNRAKVNDDLKVKFPKAYRYCQKLQ